MFVLQTNIFSRSNDLSKKQIQTSKDIFEDLKKPKKRTNPFENPMKAAQKQKKIM